MKTIKSTQSIALKPSLIAALVSIPVFAFGLSLSTPANSADSSFTASAPMLLAHADGHREMRGEGKHAGKRHSGKRHGGKGHHRGMGMKMFRGLDLTEAQRDELFKLRHANEPALRDQYKKLRAAKKSMRELTKAAQFDQAKADSVAAEIGSAAAGLATMRAKMRFDMRAVLTDEQRTKLKERMEKRGKRKQRD